MNGGSKNEYYNKGKNGSYVDIACSGLIVNYAY